MWRRMWLVTAAALLAVSCGGDDGGAAELEQSLAAVTAERDAASADLAAAQENLAAAEAELATAEADVATLEETVEGLEADKTDLGGQLEEVSAELEAALGQVEAAEAERDAALQAQADAEAAAADLRQRYDPEIQAQLAGAQGVAEQLACDAATAAGLAGDAAPDVADAIAAAAQTLPRDLREAARDRIDRSAVQARADECYATGQAEQAAAQLAAPKGDGFWTIGVEMAPGRWRSNGTADDCYWKIAPDGSPDDIIDNHFGNAGGTVTLVVGQEFETDDCGMWELVG